MDPRARNERLGGGEPAERAHLSADRMARRLYTDAAPLPVLQQLSRLQFPECELVLHTRRFGDVAVYFYLPRGILNPFAVNDEALGTPDKYITQTWLLYQLGTMRVAVPVRFPSDGASIPRLAQIITGYDPLEVHIWFDVPHDYICKHADVLSRDVGDAVYSAGLEGLARDKKMKRRQALRMILGVRLYSWLLKLTGK